MLRNAIACHQTPQRTEPVRPVDLPSWYNTGFDDHCLEIGRLTGMWAHFERGLDHLLWKLMDVHAHVGMCVTSQMIGPGPRVRAILSLIGALGCSNSLKKDFNRFATLAEILGGKRNRWAHDPIVLNVKRGYVIKTEITANRVLKYDKENVEISQIRTLWIEIRDASFEYLRLARCFFGEHPTWRRTRYEQSLANPPDDL